MSNDRIKEKIKKLFAMYNHERSNENEAETALRQAMALMAKHNIEQSDIDSGFEDFDWRSDVVQQDANSYSKNRKIWVGTLALGVAYFTDTITSWTRTVNGPAMEFSGDSVDVEHAIWLQAHLTACVKNESEMFEGNKREKTDFRRAMVRRLKERMSDIKEESKNEMEEKTEGRAVVFIDRKISERDKRFGKQSVKRTAMRQGSDRANSAGQAAGDRTGLNRSVNNSSRLLTN